MNLLEWAERNLVPLDQDGSRVATVHLTTIDGQTWQVWPRSAWDGRVEEWVREAETLLQDLLAEWPKNQISIGWTAMDDKGQVRSQLPKVVRGLSHVTQRSINTDPSKSLADSMASQAQTMGKILDAAREQVEASSTMFELAMKQNTLLFQLLQELKAERAMSEGMGAKLLEAVNPTLKHIPDLIELGREFVRSRATNGKG